MNGHVPGRRVCRKHLEVGHGRVAGLVPSRTGLEVQHAHRQAVPHVPPAHTAQRAPEGRGLALDPAVSRPVTVVRFLFNTDLGRPHPGPGVGEDRVAAVQMDLDIRGLSMCDLSYLP